MHPLVVSFLAIAALLLFLHGFFPITYNYKKFTNSRPKHIRKYPLNFEKVYKSKYDYVVFVVIDALRLDFATPKYMPILTDLVSQHGCINKITVEAPTVTLPRIKAITTGSVPQFIDVLTNLVTATVLEDSIIHSVRGAYKEVVFYGDDTWLRLFPNKFLRSEGTTSFFVKDFTEVDNNVTRNVDIELEKNDWNMMILHYLGLDHIGHVWGPFSPLIKLKLEEMDEIIYKIHASMKKRNKRTLILITGDHGMRDSGGHGGTSNPEKYVPLVVLGSSCQNSSFLQTDIPVNLAVLLGINIPSTSIGRVRRSFLSELTKEEYLYSLLYNSLLLHQKKAHVCDTHINIASQFHVKYLRRNSDIHNGNLAERLYEQCIELLSRDLFETSVEQNVYSLFISIFSLLNLLLVLAGKLTSDFNFEFLRRDFLILLIVFVQFFIHSHFSIILLIILTMLIINKIFYLKKNINTDSTLTFIISSFLLLVQPVTFLSSSYVEEEHHYWYFLINLIFLYGMIRFFKRRTVFVYLFIASTTFRLLRTINQTGDKWISIPDFSDWLMKSENLMYHQIFFVLGLFSVGICIFCLSKEKRFFEIVCAFIILGAIYCFRSTKGHNILKGRLIWLSIGVHGSLFCRKNLKIMWILIAALLIKPYSEFFITFCVFTSWILHKLFSKVEMLTLCHFVLGNVLYFAQGNSNNLASLDISVGYIGLESYQPFFVVLQVLFHNYAFIVLCHFLLFSKQRHSADKIWTILFSIRLYVVLCTCIVILVHRYHIFVWTVFAPKLFIECSHICFLFIEIVVYYTFNYLYLTFRKK